MCSLNAGDAQSTIILTNFWRLFGLDRLDFAWGTYSERLILILVLDRVLCKALLSAFMTWWFVQWDKNRVVFSDWVQHGGPPMDFIRWLRYGGALSFHSSAWGLCLPVSVLWIRHSVDWTCSQTLVPHFLAFIDIFTMTLERTNNYSFAGTQRSMLTGDTWLYTLGSLLAVLCGLSTWDTRDRTFIR